ncbi:hypothetical protein FOXG_19961 [Fusarium oxysporum f. sp. lycopersici 4287]|uniref:Uncharacterized protein n=1 Tax=Fusarium oxysporum f. sp. lycopersici (strain 4287 / CBS 123668 / FGSC 9935 / NRRL 34936) TaxID=426428 RepID=A0A0J9V901_FUSO4|nr:hypothetical protein FOXG_19961 [Fusarium oxysporum f. sp. lycopersici 4287]KNB07969.1 hypothetical protein FOXG_19961 [Fusarium oxysporum f. sp. lycopersici 4287]
MVINATESVRPQFTKLLQRLDLQNLSSALESRSIETNSTLLLSRDDQHPIDQCMTSKITVYPIRSVAPPWIKNTIPAGTEASKRNRASDVESGSQIDWSQGLLRYTKLSQVFSSLKSEVLNFVASPCEVEPTNPYDQSPAIVNQKALIIRRLSLQGRVGLGRLQVEPDHGLNLTS